MFREELALRRLWAMFVDGYPPHASLPFKGKF